MPSVDNLSEYKTTQAIPYIETCTIELHKHNISLKLNFPYHGLVAVTPQDAAKGDPHGNIDPLENVFDAHYQFRSLLLRGLIHDSPTEINSADERILTRQVSAEIKAVCLFFPGIRTERIRVCMSAWLAVVCDVDDSLEIMTPKDAEAAVSGAISILQGFSVNLKSSKSRSRNTEIFDLVQTFHAHCKAYLTEYEAQDLFHQASVVLDGFILEQRLRQGRLTLDLETYMSIRQRTIALAPMISLARSEYPPEIYPEELLNMQHDLSIVLGLQNDLVGLDKDIENGEFMNAVVVLLRDTPRTNVHISTENISDALHSIVDVYEQALSRLLYQHRQLTNSKKGHVGSTAAIADVQLCLVETHLKWCISAKRYRTEITQ